MSAVGEGTPQPYIPVLGLEAPEHPAHPQAVEYLKLVFGERNQLNDISQMQAIGLTSLVNTIDTTHAPALNFEDSRVMAASRVHGHTMEGIARNFNLSAERVALLLRGLAYRVRLFTDPDTLQQVLDEYLPGLPPDATHVAGYPRPESQEAWPHQLYNLIAKEVIPMDDGAEISVLPEVWTKPRPDQETTHYIKIVSDDTLQHPDFPGTNSLVLNDAEKAILNELLKFPPRESMTNTELIRLMNSTQHRSESILTAFKSLRELRIVTAAQEDPDTSRASDRFTKRWQINPAIVFMEKRAQYAERVTYASELDQIVAEVQEDLLYQGYFFIPDDAALGLGDELTTELKSLFDSDVVRRHDGDHPPTRKRADDSLTVIPLEAGQEMSNLPEDRPHWIVELEEGRRLIFIEDESNMVNNGSETIKERPADGYSRFMVSDLHMLQKFAAVAYRIFPLDKARKALNMRPHAFRTDGQVVEGDHRDGVKLVLLRPAERIGRGAFTQLLRRTQELNPDSPFEERPFISIKIPVNGLFGFMDDRFRHTVTYLHREQVGED